LEAALDELGVDLPVSAAENGTSALREIAVGDVSVLLVDLHMPDLHGLEVLAFWRQKRPEGARALVVTTTVSERDREKALAGGAHAFLDKPISVAALVGALEGIDGGNA
jgi:two-component system chemotaxis response regulator CheY